MTSTIKIKDRQAPISVKQARLLWSFEVHHSSSNALKWNKSGITMGNASDLIQLCLDWQDDKGDAYKLKQMLHTITLWSKDFKLIDTEPPKTIVKTETKEVIKEVVKQVHITPDMDIPTIIETILPVAKGATTIQDLYDSKPFVIPKAKTGKEYYKPVNFDLILQAIKTPEINVLLKGPAGSGKTLMARELAKQLDLDCFICSCNNGLKFHHIFGGDKIKNKESYFELANLMKAIQKPSLIVMDEIFALNAGILIGLNGLFDSGTRFIEIKDGPKIEVHPDCKIMACANTDGRNIDRTYAGATRVDGSSTDRFVTFSNGYSKRAERSISNILPKVQRDTVRTWLKDLRYNVKASNIVFDPSTRRLKACVNLIAHGMDAVNAFTAAFLGQLSPVELKKCNMNNLTIPVQEEKIPTENPSWGDI